LSAEGTWKAITVGGRVQQCKGVTMNFAWPRRAVAADADGLAALYARAYGALLEPYYDADLLAEALPLLCRINPALLESGRYFVISDQTGETVGAGGWSWEQPGGRDGTPGHAHLRHFAVDPARTRLGLGRRIFERCLQDASSARAFECFSTYAAESFYRALGFTTLGPIVVPMAPKLEFPSLHMIKRL
jgi:N-acetylglutamate synthase-like GNAT family acetyltransferase